MNKKDREFADAVKGPFYSEEGGIKYRTYRWRGHQLTFLEEDVETFEWYIMSPLEGMIPIYVKWEYRDADIHQLTEEEVKDAVLIGMNEELALGKLRIEEQAKHWQAKPNYEYNERVGISYFREPQLLTDEETAGQHKNKWCILQRYGEKMPPRVVCYAGPGKYTERLKKLYEKKYLGKGYDLFFHTGNGDGYYEKYAQDNKSVQAEYEKDGIYYYHEPQQIKWLWYLLEKADCACVVTGESEYSAENKMVCYATQAKYNDRLKMIYERDYKDKGYYLIERGGMVQFRKNYEGKYFHM